MITQEEFEIILGYKKKFKTDDLIYLYGASQWERGIVSIESNDTFILSYHHGIINFEKYTFNNRHPAIVLLRFDSMGTHTNPDEEGKIFRGPHVHIYREGFGDKIAFPVSEIGLDKNNLKREVVLPVFLGYCNVQNYPRMQSSYQPTLFSK